MTRIQSNGNHKIVIVGGTRLVAYVSNPSAVVTILSPAPLCLRTKIICGSRLVQLIIHSWVIGNAYGSCQRSFAWIASRRAKVTRWRN